MKKIGNFIFFVEIKFFFGIIKKLKKIRRYFLYISRQILKINYLEFNCNFLYFSLVLIKVLKGEQLK